MKKLTLFIAVLFAALSPGAATASSTAIPSEASIAPVVRITPVGPLDFGVLAPMGTPGHFSIDAATGTLSESNVAQTGNPSRGEFLISARPGTNIVITLSVPTLSCNPVFVNPCVGDTPTVSNLAHNFAGQVSNTNCSGIRCEDNVYVGGQIEFSGNQRGYWIGEIQVSANYQ